MFLGRKRKAEDAKRALSSALSRRVQVLWRPNEGCHIQKRGNSSLAEEGRRYADV